MSENEPKPETAILDEKNPLAFHAQSLRMVAQILETSVNDPRPQNPEFVTVLLEDAIFHIASAMQIRQRARSR